MNVVKRNPHPSAKACRFPNAATRSNYWEWVIDALLRTAIVVGIVVTIFFLITLG